MNKHRIGLDDHCEEIFQAVEDRHGLTKSEFTQRAVKLAATVVAVEGSDALPDPEADEQDAIDWARQNYPGKMLPEEMTE